VTVASRAVVAEPRPDRYPVVLPLAALLGATATGGVSLLRWWTGTLGHDPAAAARADGAVAQPDEAPSPVAPRV
jgi:hypothetical protein